METNKHISRISKSARRMYPLRYHPVQADLWNSPYRFNIVPSGRRCLEEGTLICTPQGPKQIQTLKVGDSIIGFEGGEPKVTKVTEVHNNGIQKVTGLLNRSTEYLAGTDNHKLWMCSEWDFHSKYTAKELYKRRSIKDVSKGYRVKKQYSFDLIEGGPKSVDFTYVLGALLGGGCSRDSKKASWKEVKTWDKKSSLLFLAGILDTGGSIYRKEKNQLVISIGMQSESIIDTCSNVIFRYFQEKPKRHISEHVKYKNGNIHTLTVGNNLTVKRILIALEPYLIFRKLIDVRNLVCNEYYVDRIDLKKGTIRRSRTYDITVDNSTNLYILHHGGIVTSNSGKTEIIGKRKVVRAALGKTKYTDARFGIGAPTRDQVKRIYWQDIKNMIHPKFVATKSETELSIKLIHGPSIHLFGLDKPERIEGIPWDGFVLDEYGNMKDTVWPEHIRPALSDRGGWADFIGVPEGRNHYYDLKLKAEADTTNSWGVFHWISADILSAEEIISVKNDLDLMTYRQEFEGSFLSFQGNVYYNFSEKNKRKVEYDPQDTLIFCFDFNVSPGIAAVIQEAPLSENTKNFKNIVTAIIGEVHIPRHSNTIIVTEKLIADWGDHEGSIVCYGDSTGGAEGSAKVAGTDWELIKKLLYRHYGSDRVSFNIKKKNPEEKVRVNAVNSRIRSTTGQIGLVVNPSTAPYVIRDFEGVSILEGSNGVIDKKKDSKLTHLSDSIGYYIEKRFPIKKYITQSQKFWK